MLAKAFELQGYSPVFLVQPGSKTAPRFLRAFGMRRFVVLDDYVDAALDARARDETARLLDAKPSLADLAQLTVEGAAVGRFVVSTISRARHEGAVDLASPDAQRLLRETLLVSVRSTFAAQALLDDLRPELVLFNERNYAAEAPLRPRARARPERDPVRRRLTERLAGLQALHGRDAAPASALALGCLVGAGQDDAVVAERRPRAGRRARAAIRRQPDADVAEPGVDARALARTRSGPSSASIRRSGPRSCSPRPLGREHVLRRGPLRRPGAVVRRDRARRLRERPRQLGRQAPSRERLEAQARRRRGRAR